MAIMGMALISSVSAVPSSPEGVQIGLHIKPTVDGQPLLLDSLRYRNSAGELYSVTRLSLLLSEFSLQKEDGSWVRLSEFGDDVFLDVASKKTSALLKTSLAGKYRAIRFAVGPDPQVNHGNPAVYPAKHPLNPNYNRLHWDWKGGYIFMALEGLYDDGQGYVFHLANDHNRTWVNLPMLLDLSSSVQIDLTLDIAALFSVPRPVIFSETNSTHSHEGDPLAEALRLNLSSAFQVKKVRSKQRQLDLVKVKPLYLPKAPVGFPIKLSGRFPIPEFPSDNPILVSRVALGKKLFHDPRLSRDKSISCASCHQVDHALTDGKSVSIGVDGKRGTRNSMPLFNLAWKKEFFWDGRAPSLREQTLMPISNHLEMDHDLPSVIAELKESAEYRDLFAKAFFPAEITAEKMSLAMEAFLFTKTSYDSKFDRAMKGEGKLTEEEKRGFELFMTEYEPRSKQYGADCFHCHGGALFTDHQFHNNGLKLNFDDLGRSLVTGLKRDEGKFSTPSLRNVALTGPYMHDGRFKTLEEVVKHYNEGIHRSDTLDPNLAKHPRGGLGLSEKDAAALVAFLHTLSDPQFDAKREAEKE